MRQTSGSTIQRRGVNSPQVQKTEHTNLSLLIDDGDGILQLHVMEQGLQEYVGYSDEAVVLLLVIERVCAPEIPLAYLQRRKRCRVIFQRLDQLW